MDFTEIFEGGKGDHRLHLLFEENREHHYIGGLGLGEPHVDLPALLREIADHEFPPVPCALPDERFPKSEAGLEFSRASVGADQRERLLVAIRVVIGVKDPVLGLDEPRKLREYLLGHGLEVTLAL